MNTLVIEGYDFSGRNELIEDIKRQINGVTIVEPFRMNLGELVVWLYNEKRYNILNNILLDIITKEESNVKENNLIVFDRHWTTVFSFIPEKYRYEWFPLPKTIICWTPPDIVLKRMQASMVEIPLDGYVEYCCKIYKELSIKFGCKFIDTSIMTREDVLKTALKYIDSEFN